MKRVMLTTGGTGGHIFPALAVVEEISARFPDAEFLFVGGEYGPERNIVTRAGIPFEGLPVRGVLGRGIKAIGALCGMTMGILRALRLIGKFQPDVIIGFGGYAAFAACMAGKLREIPVAVHEQNSIPGLANRMIGKMAERIFISMPDPDEHFSRHKTVLTGNPVRNAIVELRGTEKKNSMVKRLLVVGGSLGARAINQAVIDMLPQLHAAGVHIVHQTGTADCERVQAAYTEAGMGHCVVSPFIDDMAMAYAESDVVLCRAGATTIAEITVAGKPAIFIPFPHATHNHQVHNARFLEERGAAFVVEENALATTDVAALLNDLFIHPERLDSMASASRKEGKPAAAASVVSGMIDILRKTPLQAEVQER